MSFFVLDSTLKSLEVKLAGAVTTNQLDWVVSSTDILDSTQGVSDIAESDGVTNNGTAVALVAAPAAGHTKVTHTISVYNADTVNATVTLQINNNGTKRILFSKILTAGQTLLYGNSGVVVL
jgi:hypothetical protein